MTIDPEPTLSSAQRQYVSDVDIMLRPLPRALREDLLDSLRQNLAERGQPAATTRSSSRDDAAPDYWPGDMAEIERALGTPAEYAAALIADAEQADPGLMTRSRRRHRRRVGLAVAVVVLLLGGGAGTFTWWIRWDPGFGAPMNRICTAFESNTACGQDGVTDLSPANMTRISCVPDRKLFLTVGLTADSAVTITGASFFDGIGVGNVRPDDLGPFSDQIFRIDAIEPWVRPTMQDYTAPSRWPITVGPDGMLPEVLFTLTMCPTDSDSPRPAPGSGTILETFELRYHALGRDRVATIDLPTPIAIIAPQ
jgi:hypothetical protein